MRYIIIPVSLIFLFLNGSLLANPPVKVIGTIVKDASEKAPEIIGKAAAGAAASTGTAALEEAVSQIGNLKAASAGAGSALANSLRRGDSKTIQMLSSAPRADNLYNAIFVNTSAMAPSSENFAARHLNGFNRMQIDKTFAEMKNSGSVLFYTHMGGMLGLTGWYTPVDAFTKMGAQEILNMLQRMRRFYNINEINWYAVNCHMGSAIDELLVILGPSEIKGVNVFAEAGGMRQVNLFSFYNVAGGEPSLTQDMVKRLVKSINDVSNYTPKIGVKALIDGNLIYPLKDAVQAALKSGNKKMARQLKALYDVMESASPAQLKKNLANLEKEGFTIANNGDDVTKFAVSNITGLYEAPGCATFAIPKELLDFVAKVAGENSFAKYL